MILVGNGRSVFNGGPQTKTPRFKAPGFEQKVVVIDEVHAYDAHMSQYLHQVVYAGCALWRACCHPVRNAARRPQGGIGRAVLVLARGLQNQRMYPAARRVENRCSSLNTYSDGKAIQQVHALRLLRTRRFKSFATKMRTSSRLWRIR